MKSNDSPEIPDRGETSDIPDLPSGVVTYKAWCIPVLSHNVNVTHRTITGMQSLLDNVYQAGVSRQALPSRSDQARFTKQRLQGKVYQARFIRQDLSG